MDALQAGRLYAGITVAVTGIAMLAYLCMALRYGVEIGEEEGRVVLRRVERGPLSAARLRGGEVLRAIEGLPVRDAAQARRLLLGVRGGRVHLRVGLPWGEAEVVAASR